MVVINLVNVYGRVPREVMCLVFNAVPLKYIKLIKDIYDGVATSVRTSGGITSEFPFIIGLHQGSTLSSYLFALVMDELT